MKIVWSPLALQRVGEAAVFIARDNPGSAEAMPTILGTLDSIQLAATLEIGRHIEAPLVLATHDAQLARAARAFGLEVVDI